MLARRRRVSELLRACAMALVRNRLDEVVVVITYVQRPGDHFTSVDAANDDEVAPFFRLKVGCLGYWSGVF
jgi:hypothetical protein